MTLPVASNTTCDIYRSTHSPPSSPDVAGVACFLTGSYYQGLEHGEKDPLNMKFSHWMIVDLGTDIRDDYGFGARAGNPDTIWVPNQNGTSYVVVFVERKRSGADYKKVYLSRKAVGSWPTQQV